MKLATWGDPLPEPPPRRPSAGPWTSHDTDEGEWVVDIPDDGEITVGRLFFGDMETNTGRDISNADLVSAAPDLFEAVMALYAINDLGDYGYDIRERGGKGWDGPQVVAWGEACAKLQAAIKKVTGEARP